MAGIDNDLEFDDSGGRITFDFQGFIFKVIRNWVLILVSIVIGLGIADYVNVRKQNIYRLNALVSVESEQNPFFTANTSISFNWGGVSGKIGKVMTTLATRSHNELVVDSLQFYKKYLKQGKYHLVDVYKAAPFEAIIDKNQYQVLGEKIQIQYLDKNQFKLICDFGESTNISAQRYSDRKKTNIAINPGVFEQTFFYGEAIQLPFFTGIINNVANIGQGPSDQYYLQFLNFDSVVSTFQNSVAVSFFKGSSTVLSLSQAGNNKTKIVIEIVFTFFTFVTLLDFVSNVSFGISSSSFLCILVILIFKFF